MVSSSLSLIHPSFSALLPHGVYASKCQQALKQNGQNLFAKTPISQREFICTEWYSALGSLSGNCFTEGEFRAISLWVTLLCFCTGCFCFILMGFFFGGGKSCWWFFGLFCTFVNHNTRDKHYWSYALNYLKDFFFGVLALVLRSYFLF